MTFRRVAVVASSALLGGCLAVYGFDDYDTGRPLPDDEAGAGAAATLPFVLDRPAPLVLHRGDQGSVAVAVERNGDSAEVVLTADAPAGITITSATIAPEASTGTLVVTTSATAPLGVVPVTIHARAATTTLDLAVVGATLDPSFGDGGIIVGAVGESFVGLAADATDRATVAVRSVTEGWTVYQEDTRGVLSTLEYEGFDDGDLVSVAAVGLTTILASTAADATSMHISGYRARIARWGTDIDPPSLDVPHIVAFASGPVRVVTTEGHGQEQLGIDSHAIDIVNGDTTEHGIQLIADIAATVAAVTATSDRALVCTSTSVDGPGVVAVHGLRSDGTLDRSFADAGSWRKAGPGETELACLDIVAVGGRAIVLTLSESHVASVPLLFALDANGVEDDTFGDAGVVDLGDASAFALTSDARHVLVAEQSQGVARVIALGSDGRPDPAFGDATGGLVVPLPGSAARGVRVLSDGRVLVAGSFDDGTGARWFVAAFRP